MNVKLEQYRVFAKVAEMNSFSKAAEALFMSQSAVSQSIKNLEESLGVPLFVRKSKGVTLTYEAEDLYNHISQALSLFEEGENRLNKHRQLVDGELRIGVSDTISKYLLLPYLEQFNRLHPKIKLKIQNRTSKEAVTLLKEGKIDLAFINLPYFDNSIEISQSIEIHDIFVAGNKYAALKNKKLTSKQFLEYPLILLDSSNTRSYIENFFSNEGIQINPEIELGSYDLLFEFARINLGIACVIKEFAQDQLLDDQLFVVNTTFSIPSRNIGICKLKHKKVSPCAAAFVTLMQTY